MGRTLNFCFFLFMVWFSPPPPFHNSHRTIFVCLFVCKVCIFLFEHPSLVCELTATLEGIIKVACCWLVVARVNWLADGIQSKWAGRRYIG